MICEGWKHWIEEKCSLITGCIIGNYGDALFVVRYTQEDYMLCQLTCRVDPETGNLLIHLGRNQKTLDTEIVEVLNKQSRLIDFMHKTELKPCRGLGPNEVSRQRSWVEALNEVYIEPFDDVGGIIIRSQSCSYVLSGSGIKEDGDDVCVHCMALRVSNSYDSSENKLNNFVCPLCSLYFSESILFKEHVRSCSSNCDLIEATDTDEYQGEQDEEEEPDVEPSPAVLIVSSCQNLKAELKDAFSYEDHSEKCMNTKKDTKKSIRKKKNERSVSRRHRRSISQNLKCIPCGKYFKYSTVFNRHRMCCGGNAANNSLNTGSSGGGGETCAICFKQLDSQIWFDQHWNSHLEYLKPLDALSCGICFTVCGGIVDFNEHFASAHADTPSETCCAICFSRTDRSKLSRHYIRMHSGDNKHLCPLCGRKFKFECLLRMHVLKHENRLQFVCQHCGISFTTLYSLNEHILKFHKEDAAKYVCNFCNKKFVRAKKYEEHTRTHLGIKPYKCKLCLFKSGKKYNVLSHCKKVHGVENFTYAAYVETNMMDLEIKDDVLAK